MRKKTRGAVVTVVGSAVVTAAVGSPVGMLAGLAAAASVAVGLGLVASGVVQLAVSVAGRWLPRSHIYRWLSPQGISHRGRSRFWRLGLLRSCIVWTGYNWLNVCY